MSRESDQRITVTGSRLVPTKPYGSDKWEFTIERDLDDDEIISQVLYEAAETITDMLDHLESQALRHANPS